MSHPKDHERRKHKRVAVAGRVHVLNDDTQDARYLTTSDLSVGGAFVLARPPVPVGTEVRLEVALSGVRQVIPLVGKVVRVEDGERVGSAIEFVDTPDEFIVLLQEFVASQE